MKMSQPLAPSDTIPKSSLWFFTLVEPISLGNRIRFPQNLESREAEWRLWISPSCTSARRAPGPRVSKDAPCLVFVVALRGLFCSEVFWLFHGCGCPWIWLPTTFCILFAPCLGSRGGNLPLPMAVCRQPYQLFATYMPKCLHSARVVLH